LKSEQEEYSLEQSLAKVIGAYLLEVEDGGYVCSDRLAKWIIASGCIKKQPVKRVTEWMGNSVPVVDSDKLACYDMICRCHCDACSFELDNFWDDHEVVIVKKGEVE